MNEWPHPFVRLSKALANLVALIVVAPAAFTCWVEKRLRPGSEGVFWFWTQIGALMPGPPGVYLRRAFYSMTLDSCSLTCWIAFGALFSHRSAHVEDDVYVGTYAVVGSARLCSGCLIGTRASVPSGSAQHELADDGRWLPGQFQQITIGPHAWIGEAAIVMADVGAGAMIAAGSVVSTAVPPAVVVAGNPARFVRHLRRPDAGVPAPLAAPVPEPGGDRSGMVDWLKCLGMLVIVYGHVAGWAPLAALAPIYSKQLGVAFFVFVTGYLLSQDTRGRWHVAFNRLFEVLLFGTALALIMSAITFAREGRLQISNYAPLLGGVNVLFNFFPANPTTWYLGTYLHLILLWALIAYRIRVSIPLLVLSFAAEIAVRTLLMQTAGSFVAYMALPNWATVFLLGTWYGQRPDRSVRLGSDHAALAAGVVLVGLVVGWAALVMPMAFQPGFPFMKPAGYGAAVGALVTSVFVSAVYLGSTWLTFVALTPVGAPRAVRFISRHTLVIFLAHMPIYDSLQPALEAWGASRLLNSTILMLVCIPGLALLSEAIRRSSSPRVGRDRVFGRLQALWRAPSGTAS